MVLTHLLCAYKQGYKVTKDTSGKCYTKFTITGSQKS